MPITIVFEGEFACFTRPEFATERLSYEVPTPTSARGMIEMIFWKPEIRYWIHRVAKLPHSSGKPTRFVRVTTNEVKVLAPCDVDERDTSGNPSRRAQRRNLVLRNAAFLVEVEILPGARAVTKPGHNPRTYYEMLTRRVERGQCIETPCLGIRDYPASFRLATRHDVPVDETRPLGPMSYIVWDKDNWRSRDEPQGDGQKVVTQPMVIMESGVIDMRDWAQ